MNQVSQHKPGLLAVRLDDVFRWRERWSSTWQVEDLSNTVFIVADKGLPPDEVVDSVRYRIFERDAHLYGVQFEWMKGASMVG